MTNVRVLSVLEVPRDTMNCKNAGCSLDLFSCSSHAFRPVIVILPHFKGNGTVYKDYIILR